MAPRATVGPCREMELEDEIEAAAWAMASPSHEMELEDQVARAVEGGVLLAPLPFGVESSDDGGKACQPQRRWRHRAVAAAAVGLCAALVLGCMALAQSPLQRVHSGRVQGAVGLQAAYLGPMLQGLSKAIEGVESVQHTYANGQKAVKNIQEFAQEANSSQMDLDKFWKKEAEARRRWRELNASAKARIRAELHAKYNITVPTKLRPPANLTDGNPCQDDEEYHLGLCYKKCSLITQGAFSQRSTAFECCRPESCSNDFSFVLGLCKGNNVAGDSIGGGCPHLPGGCLKNEEILHGMCYKKCSLLTWGHLPYRWGAVTCCKGKEGTTGIALLDSIFKSGCDSNESFAIGGGGSDKDNSTPAGPHAPLVDLTEGIARKSA